MQIYVDRKKKISDTDFFIYDDLYRLIFTSKAKNILSYMLSEISLNNSSQESICYLRQINILLKLLSIIPVVGMFVECPYYFYKDSVCKGRTKRMYASYEIKIDKNTYRIRLHTECKISIWLNENQVGIVNKITTSELDKDRFCVIFNSTLDVETIALLTIFALVTFLDDYGMSEIRYTYVPFDKYNIAEWKPEE